MEQARRGGSRAPAIISRPHARMGFRMKVPSKLVELRGRAEPVVKNFEWTWTKALVFCLGLWFFILITAVVIPSFWMYFAEQKLGWGGPSGTGDPWLTVRDAVALALTSGPLLTIIVAAVLMQNWRRKLRGATAERPTGGYR